MVVVKIPHTTARLECGILRKTLLAMSNDEINFLFVHQ
jgi:hypothetical protein